MVRFADLLGAWRTDSRAAVYLAEVERVGRGSAELAALRQELRQRFEGTRCLVVGSAPDVSLPKGPFETAICVNGSGWGAARLGIAVADLTVIAGSNTTGNKDIRRATLAAWKGLRTKDLIYIEAGNSAEDGRAIIDEAGLGYERFSTISKIEKDAVIAEAVSGLRSTLGKSGEERISTGIFSAVLAIWAGAGEVILSGFSLQGGHAYVEAATPRNHQAGDRRFLSLAKNLSPRVATTSGALHDAFSLPLA